MCLPAVPATPHTPCLPQFYTLFFTLPGRLPSGFLLFLPTHHPVYACLFCVVHYLPSFLGSALHFATLPATIPFLFWFLCYVTVRTPAPTVLPARAYCTFFYYTTCYCRACLPPCCLPAFTAFLPFTACCQFWSYIVSPLPTLYSTTSYHFHSTSFPASTQTYTGPVFCLFYTPHCYTMVRFVVFIILDYSCHRGTTLPLPAAAFAYRNKHIYTITPDHTFHPLLSG